MISVVIITLNEEDNISNAIKSLAGLDEIIVVDSGSIDRTVEIAKKLGAKVYIRKFDNFASQKNWAVSKVMGGWLFSLDADERIPKELVDEIKKAVKSKKYVGYLIPRRNFILGAEIKYSRWSPDKHIWLWKKNYGKWVGDVHEEVIVKGLVGELENSKLHYSHKTISEFIKANDFYSTLLSKSMHKGNCHFSIYKMFWDVIFEFNIRYFYKLGFLDGFRGFALSYLMAIYQLTMWIKLWELENKMKNK